MREFQNRLFSFLRHKFLNRILPIPYSDRPEIDWRHIVLPFIIIIATDSNKAIGSPEEKRPVIFVFERGTFIKFEYRKTVMMIVSAEQFLICIIQDQSPVST